MNTKTFIPIFLTFVTISIISLSGCERIQHVITSETVTPGHYVHRQNWCDSTLRTRH